MLRLVPRFLVVFFILVVEAVELVVTHLVMEEDAQAKESELDHHQGAWISGEHALTQGARPVTFHFHTTLRHLQI